MIARRRLLAATGPMLLSGCGFQLRQAPQFAFQTIYIASGPNSSTVRDIRRGIATGSNVKVVNDPSAAQVVLDVVLDRREQVVVGLNATGEVREFQLRSRFQFRLRTAQGKELIPLTELLQQRDISYTESAALAKEDEQQLLYRDMQADIVLQLMQRLAAVKTIA